jgi:hypothetical protein
VGVREPMTVTETLRSNRFVRGSMPPTRTLPRKGGGASKAGGKKTNYRLCPTYTVQPSSGRMVRR